MTRPISTQFLVKKQHKFEIVISLKLQFAMNNHLFVVTVSALFAQCHTLDIVHAINLGGPAYTSENGITYQADSEIQPYSYFNWTKAIGVVEPDLTLYKRERGWLYNYTLPVTGEGWYGLVLHTVTVPYASYFRMKLNTITLWDAHTPKSGCETAWSTVCNKVYYFSVCNSVAHYQRTSTQVPDNKLVLQVPREVKVNAILLVKGMAGESKSVITNVTKLYFDPAQERKCIQA
jgi:Malectin domain